MHNDIDCSEVDLIYIINKCFDRMNDDKMIYVLKKIQYFIKENNNHCFKKNIIDK